VNREKLKMQWQFGTLFEAVFGLSAAIQLAVSFLVTGPLFLASGALTLYWVCACYYYGYRRKQRWTQLWEVE
jgi:hypothetical protein